MNDPKANPNPSGPANPARPAGGDPTDRSAHHPTTSTTATGQRDYYPTVEGDHGSVSVFGAGLGSGKDHRISADSVTSAAPRMTTGSAVEQEVAARRAECDRATDLNAPGSRPPQPYPIPGRRYVLIEPIGHGTYGSVWKAHAPGNEQRVVAVKFFPRGHARSTGGMARELEAIRQLTNQHGFIQVLDVDETAEWPFFVMSYAPTSLHRLLYSTGPDGTPVKTPMPVRKAVAVFTRIVRAMAHAHSAEVKLCHCDLKPSNVLMTGKEGGDPLIADFGQSRLVDQPGRAVLGSYFYMPPDQATLGNEGVVDPRWDVYALGAIAYELVVPNTSGQPRRDRSWDDVASTLASKGLQARLDRYTAVLKKAKPPAEHRKVRGMDGSFAAIIDRCLDLDPDRRFRDAGEVLTALRTRERGKRWKPIVAVGLAANLICLVVLSAWVYHGQRKTVDAQRKNLTEQVGGGQRDTALVAGKLLEDKIGRRVRFLESHARSADRTTAAAGGPLAAEFAAARDALTTARRKSRQRHDWQLINRWLIEDRRPVNDWLVGVTQAAWRDGLFDEQLVANLCADGACYNFGRVYDAAPDGQPAAMAVDVPWANEKTVKQFTRDFSYRDWYGDTGYRLSESDPLEGLRKPITAPHVSVLFKSTRKSWILVVTAPIWGADPDTGDRTVVGLLGGLIDVKQDLTEWIQETETATPGAEREKIQLIVVNDRGHLIWHPDLDEKLRLSKNVDEPTEVYTACELYGRESLPQFDAKTPDAAAPDADAPGPDAPVEFRDPWDEPAADGTRPVYFARKTAFYPLGRGDGKAPWHVIVKKEQSVALKPVSEFEQSIWDDSLLTLGMFLGMSVLIWGGVFWALKQTEDDGNG